MRGTEQDPGYLWDEKPNGIIQAKAVHTAGVVYTGRCQGQLLMGTSCQVTLTTTKQEPALKMTLCFY